MISKFQNKKSKKSSSSDFFMFFQYASSLNLMRSYAKTVFRPIYTFKITITVKKNSNFEYRKNFERGKFESFSTVSSIVSQPASERT